MPPRLHQSSPFSLLVGPLVLSVCGLAMLVGCGQTADPQPEQEAKTTQQSTRSIKTAELNQEANKRDLGNRSTPTGPIQTQRANDDPAFRTEEPQERMLGALLKQSQSDDAFIPAPIDETQVRTLGIRKVSGRYIDLYTDVRDDVVDEYVQAFDLAVPQWSAYFDVAVPEPDEFHVRGSLMQDKDRFRTAKLLPVDSPPFPHGYQDGAEIWVYPKPGDYFTRHLILHEGTHAFMRRVLHGAGPPWYMEGIAELLATHRWHDGQLQLGYTLKSNDEAPYWGRLGIVQAAFEEGRSPSLEAILQYGWRAHLQTEPYGWSWAACAFFDGHPLYRPVFRQLRDNVTDQTITFSQKFIDALPGNWNQVTEQWQLFIAEMDFGYDLERTAISYRPTHLPEQAESIAVRADRGWQSSGLRLEAGTTYRIQATGDVILAPSPKPWRSEANGITIHYYKGKPLGILLGAIRDQNSRLEGLTPLATPFVIGQDLEIRPDSSGTLFLRINDSPTDLANNRGEFDVLVTPIPSSSVDVNASPR